MASATVHVDSDALQALRDVVYARYGRIHGVLCEEASKAIRTHVEKMMAELAAETAQQEGNP